MVDRTNRSLTQRNIHSVKTKLDNLLRNTAYSSQHANATKRLVYKILNTSAAEAIRDLYATDICPPAELLSLIRELDQLKQSYLADHIDTSHKYDNRNERNTFFFLITKQERQMLQRLALSLAENMKLQSIIWLHDGIWIYPAPTEQTIQKATAACLPDIAEPATLFRLTPISDYIHKDEKLRKCYQLLQLESNNSQVEQDNSTWHKRVIKDSATKATRAKQIRDLIIENKRVILRTSDRPSTKTIHDFFKKKGLHVEN